MQSMFIGFQTLSCIKFIFLSKTCCLLQTQKVFTEKSRKFGVFFGHEGSITFAVTCICSNNSNRSSGDTVSHSVHVVSAYQASSYVTLGRSWSITAESLIM